MSDIRQARTVVVKRILEGAGEASTSERHLNSVVGQFASAFDSNPFDGLSPVGECAHLDGFTVTEGEDISQANVVPFAAVFRLSARMNKHNDLVTGNNESLWLAMYFGPSRARSRQVCLHSFVPMIRSASWKLGRLSPLDLGVERFNSGSNIVPVECSVCFSESLGLSRKRRIQGVHFSLPAALVTGALNQNRDGAATASSLLPHDSHVMILSTILPALFHP